MNTIEEAIQDIKAGKIIIIIDDEERENEGDFVVAAQLITTQKVNFMLKEGRGILCVALPEQRCKELRLSMMEQQNTSLSGTPFTVSVDLLGPGMTTGVAATERSATIRALVDTSRMPSEFGRPGHIFPLRAQGGGVLKRAGHTEAVVDITTLAGLHSGGALIEIMNEDGSMARLPDLEKIASQYNLKMISIKDLITYRKKNKV